MPIISTKIDSGQVKGTLCGNQRISVFKGIPYATASQRNRFRPPEQVEPWSDERSCDQFGSICMQNRLPKGSLFEQFFRKEVYPVDFPMQEDSLFLNIWTPASSIDERLPVMFWIHGGGMTTGYGHEMIFDGEAIAKRGVILVTINYRLGYFGFFAHPELRLRSPDGRYGNNGILDQIAALQWVQRNIRSFGGDPDRVTIFGQSGGGGSVISHLVSPLSEGLFHQAIIQSGVAGITQYAADTRLEDAEQWGVKACEILGKTVDDLLGMPAEELQAALTYAERNGAGPFPKQVRDGNVFPKTIETAIKTGDVKPVPILLGSLNGDFGPIDPASKPANPIEAAASRVFGKKVSQYFEKFPLIDPEKQKIHKALLRSETFLKDMTFVVNQIHNNKPGYYVYYIDTSIPDGDEFGFVQPGISYHSSEMWFIFGTLNRCWRNFDGRYYDLSRTLTAYWTNFAKTGNPNQEDLPEWPIYQKENPVHLKINERNIEPEICIDDEIWQLIAFNIF